MKRKLLSLTLAAVLALSLTACGGGNGLGNSAEAKALNESMSDIMGSLIEGKSGDGKWVMGEDADGSTRSLSSPDIKHYDAFDPENDEHDNSGIYTYAAYLMMTDSRTAGISDETWARVFYLSMFMLPSDAVMTDGPITVKNQATRMAFRERWSSISSISRKNFMALSPF